MYAIRLNKFPRDWAGERTATSVSCHCPGSKTIRPMMLPRMAETPRRRRFIPRIASRRRGITFTADPWRGREIRARKKRRERANTIPFVGCSVRFPSSICGIDCARSKIDPVDYRAEENAKDLIRDSSHPWMPATATRHAVASFCLATFK